MKAQLLRRLITLETRKQAPLRPLKSRFPAWLITEWQNERIAVDDQGVFEWDRMKASGDQS